MHSRHPGQFPVGSAASRAAARNLIEERRSSATLAEIVFVQAGLDKPSFGQWKENTDGSFTRRSRIPEGMTVEEAEKAAGLPPIEAKGEHRRILIDV